MEPPALKFSWNSGLEISSFQGNQWSFSFKVASVTMVSYILRPLIVTLTFEDDNCDYRYPYHNR